MKTQFLPTYFFIIDVSNQAREQGLIKTVCETVINVIKKGGFPENA